MFPVMLNVEGRVTVVVGGGSVGRRKVAAAHAAGAAVRLIDPRPAPPPVLEGVMHIHEPYRDDLLDGAALVFACATAEVNARVAADARARRIWVNSATGPDDCDIVLPAVLRRGDLAIAVSTGGASPALARRIRDRLETEFDAAFADWLQLLNELRPLVLAKVADPGRRRELLASLADWYWLERLRSNRLDDVRREMQDHISGFGA